MNLSADRQDRIEVTKTYFSEGPNNYSLKLCRVAFFKTKPSSVIPAKAGIQDLVSNFANGFPIKSFGNDLNLVLCNISYSKKSFKKIKTGF